MVRHVASHKEHSMRKEEKAHHGQTICTETGPDRSSYKVKAAEVERGRR